MWNTRYAGKQAGTVVMNGDGNEYIQIAINGKMYFAHRVAWAIFYGVWPEKGIDHRDGDGLSNRIKNLRDIGPLLNNRNMKRNRNNISGVNGVCRVSRRRRWQAQIQISGINYFLGYFIDWFDAVCARKSAEAKFGGFTERHGR